MLTLVPMLAVQRELYELPRGHARFRKYLAVMTGGTDDIVLPLQAMNPMGKEHVARTLDALIAVGAEHSAADAIADVEQRLGHVTLPLRVGIVITDDVGGGWTNRELIEAQRLRSVPEATLKRGWL